MLAEIRKRKVEFQKVRKPLKNGKTTVRKTGDTGKISDEVGSGKVDSFLPEEALIARSHVLLSEEAHGDEMKLHLLHLERDDHHDEQLERRRRALAWTRADATHKTDATSSESEDDEVAPRGASVLDLHHEHHQMLLGDIALPKALLSRFEGSKTKNGGVQGRNGGSGKSGSAAHTFTDFDQDGVDDVDLFDFDGDGFDDGAVLRDMSDVDGDGKFSIAEMVLI
jgi:hypothetical protein